MVASEADEAWCPPTFSPSSLSRRWFALWMVQLANHSTLRSNSPRIARSAVEVLRLVRGCGISAVYRIWPSFPTRHGCIAPLLCATFSGPAAFSGVLLDFCCDGIHVADPGQRRAAPDLPRGGQRIALTQCRDPNAIERRVVAHVRAVNGASAIAAKGLYHPGSAVGLLDVGLRLPGQQLKGVLWNADDHAERGTGERLAIGAVADQDLGWIDLRLVCDA